MNTDKFMKNKIVGIKSNYRHDYIKNNKYNTIENNSSINLSPALKKLTRKSKLKLSVLFLVPTLMISSGWLLNKETDKYLNKDKFKELLPIFEESIDDSIKQESNTNENEVTKSFKGIDVSEHQGNIDWDTTKDYIDYAIIRVCDFYNKDEAIDEANFVLDAVKLDYPIYFDIEADKHKDMIANDLNNAIELTEAFCSTIQNNKYYSGIYSSNSMLNDLTKNSSFLSKYDKWIANYGLNEEQSIEDVKPSSIDFKGTYYMQQATSKATIPGIDGYIDVDFGYVDFPKLIEQSNLNKKVH